MSAKPKQPKCTCADSSDLHEDACPAYQWNVDRWIDWQRSKGKTLVGTELSKGAEPMNFDDAYLKRMRGCAGLDMPSSEWSKLVDDLIEARAALRAIADNPNASKPKVASHHDQHYGIGYEGGLIDGHRAMRDIAIAALGPDFEHDLVNAGTSRMPGDEGAK